MHYIKMYQIAWSMLQRYADVVHYTINIKQLGNTITLKE